MENEKAMVENMITVNPFGETTDTVEQDFTMLVLKAGEVARVQGQIVSAKKFPRDESRSYANIMTACSRQSLAKVAVYAYPRGGQAVKGPSIRLAEQLARSWGNIDTGIRELSQEHGESTVEAYAHDLETNYRASKIFSVKHRRYTKKGITNLDDPRDVYELVANAGARRMRACILAVIPGDVCEDAVNKCEQTLAGNISEPLEDRVKKMVVAFKQLNETISQEMLEARLTHSLEETTMEELNDLSAIFRSLKDGMTKRHDWFNLEKGEQTEKSKSLNEKFAPKSTTKTTPKKKPRPPSYFPPDIMRDCESLAELRDVYNTHSKGWEQDYGPDMMQEFDEVYGHIKAELEYANTLENKG